jgi:hypothetical protein
MKKLLVFILCAFAFGATRCKRKPTPKAEVPAKSDSALAAERAKELEFSFPAEALAPMTESEIQAYVRTLPRVVSVLKAANFKAPYLEGSPRLVFAAIGLLADSMKATPGFSAALENSGMKYAVFRARFTQTWAAGYAVSLDSSLAAFREQGRDTLPDAPTVLAVFEPRIRACAQIPPANKELVRKYRAALDLLRRVL